METEPSVPAAGGSRPRPFLLVLLGLVLVAFLWITYGGSAGPSAPPSNPPSVPQARGQGGTNIDPAALNVRLEALASGRPELGGTARNPFRFRPKPPPPPPREDAGRPAPSDVNSGPTEPQPSSPPPPPPITVKFIGVLDLPDGTQVAVFTDCSSGRRQTHAREGGTVDGRYRLVKIGLQSVVIEHLDGRGRTTIAQGGQECVGK